VNSPGNDYTYNGKELNEDFGLNLYDYGARWYDAALGRWHNIDILAECFFEISPYGFVANNPLRYMDFMGMTIINGHQAEREAASNNLETAKKNRAEYSESDKKTIKKLDKSVRKAEGKFNSSDEKFKAIETAISDFKEYNPDAYSQLDNLKDGLGGKVDAYIRTDGILMDPLGNSIDGITESAPRESVFVRGADEDKGTTVYRVSSSSGPNTVIIKINSKVGDKGETLAHESGHALYDVPNFADNLEYQNRHPNSHGHGAGDPSGERAKKEEGVYRKNKKTKNNEIFNSHYILFLPFAID